MANSTETANDHLMKMLDDLGIKTTTTEHVPLRTVEDARFLRGELPGAHVKNLFLKDKKKCYWLIVALEDAIVNLKQLAALLEAQRFSFASAEELCEILGILPGSVSPLAVINDTKNLVSIILDKQMMEFELLNFHPLRNDRTTTITTSDFLKFLEATKHSPRIVNIPV